MTLTEQVPGSGRRTDGTRRVRSRWGAASVICGFVHTANATVYLIDSVLSPKS